MVDEQNWKVKWIRSHLIPLLDKNRKWEEGISEERVKEAEVALAKAYLEEGTGILRQFAIVGAPLVLIDFLLVFPAQIYGLVFSMVGTWILLVESDFQDRFSIAIQAKPELPHGIKPPLNPSQKKRLAHQSVMANIGLVWLTLGFSLQILALIISPSGNAIKTDMLLNWLSSL